MDPSNCSSSEAQHKYPITPKRSRSSSRSISVAYPPIVCPTFRRSNSGKYIHNVYCGNEAASECSAAQQHSSSSCMMATASTSAMHQHPCYMIDYCNTVSCMSKAIQPQLEDVRKCREKEKVELQKLNENLAQYLNKVNCLEEENRCLVNELTRLQSSLSKALLDVDCPQADLIQQLRNQVKEAEIEKDYLEWQQPWWNDTLDTCSTTLQSRGHTHPLQTPSDMVKSLTKQVEKVKQDTDRVRHRYNDILKENACRKEEEKPLLDEIEKLKKLGDDAALKRIQSEKEAALWFDKLEFEQKLFHAKLQQLRNITLPESLEEQDFWHCEMANALADIEKQYNEKIRMLEKSVEDNFEMEMKRISECVQLQSSEADVSRQTNQQLKTKLKELQKKLNDSEQKKKKLQETLRHQNSSSTMEDANRCSEECKQLCKKYVQSQRKIETLLRELKTLTDAKLDLKVEIATYRKLLESQGSSTKQIYSACSTSETITESKTSIFQHILSPEDFTDASSKVSLGSLSSISINSAVVDNFSNSNKVGSGKILLLRRRSDRQMLSIENISSETINLGGMTIREKIEFGKKCIQIVLPNPLMLEAMPPCNILKIWSHGSKVDQKFSAGHELELDGDKWITGENTTTVLYDQRGKVVAKIATRNPMTQ